MKQFILTVWQFYRDGFRSMKLGLFFILRLFFFPDFLNQVTKSGEKDGYVSHELIERMP